MILGQQCINKIGAPSGVQRGETWAVKPADVLYRVATLAAVIFCLVSLL